MKENHYSWIAPLLHFSDSALPVGAYAHSFGLEGLVHMGMVKDVDDLELFLIRDVTQALVSIDLPLTAHAHRAAMDMNEVELNRLDQLSWAMRPTRQLREAASQIGRQQWKIYQANWAGENPADIKLKHCQGPVVMGISYAAQDVPSTAALWSVAYQTYSALLQASLKLIPIGPSATQRLLRAALENIEPRLEAVKDVSEEEMGSFNPLWDIAAAKHERAKARLFIS